jgi:hypothetical protein
MSTYSDNIKAIDKLYNESLSPFIDSDELHKRIEYIADEYEKKYKGKNIFKINTWKNSIIRRLLQVHERVLLVRNLKQRESSTAVFLERYMYPPLCTYLLLTCFDQLGQPPNGWLFFPDWLKSNSKKNERDSIINEIYENEKNINFVEKLYNKYHEIYGVKNSFYRFLREILTQDQRNILLNEILIELHKDYPQNLLEVNYGNEFNKEIWLYNVRNNYTHSIYSTENNILEGAYKFGRPWYMREFIYGDVTQEVYVSENFNAEMEKSIIIGILKLIELHSKNYK